MANESIQKVWGNIEYSMDENAFNFLLNELVREVLESPNESTPTAQSIARKAPLSEIAKCAREEGLEDFSQALHCAES